MAIAYVRDLGQHTTTGTGQTDNASFGTLPAVNNRVIGLCGDWFTGQANGAFTYSDNQANSWATDVQLNESNNAGLASIGSALVATSSGTFTVTVNATGTTNTFYTWTAVEFSGLATATPFDKSASLDGAASATSLTITATPTLSQADELIVSVVTLDTSINHTSITASGFTSVLNQADGATINPAGAGYKIVADTAGVSVPWAWTTGTTTGEVGVTATYKGAAAGPPIFPRSDRIAATVFPG